MAESSLQQLSSELGAVKSESQDCAQLLQMLYSGVVDCSVSLNHSMTMASEESSAAAREHLSYCRTAACESALPDQATVTQLLTQLEQVVSKYTGQSQQIKSVTQQLEAYSADCAKAALTLAGAMQPQDCIQVKQGSLGAKRPGLQLLQLSDCAAAGLNDQNVRLTQSQSQVECVSQQLSQAQTEREASEAELTRSQQQLQEAIKQTVAAQNSLQQVRHWFCFHDDQTC